MTDGVASVLLSSDSAMETASVLNNSGVNDSTLIELHVSAVEFRFLQPVWDLRIGHENVLASPLFPIVVSLVMYIVCVIPFMIADLYGTSWHWLQRFKIQPDRPVGWAQISRAMVLTLWNHVLYILPVSVAQCVWTPNIDLPDLAPALFEFCWQHVAALVIFDTEYYVWHVVHHRVRWLYRHIHSVHHQYSSPSSWVTEFLHPWELFSIGVFTTTSTWWFGAHPLTQWSFMQFSIIISVEAHCGYDLPLAPHRWLPFWGGSVHHDMHHQRPLTNFQPFLNLLDRLFGTYCPGQRAGGFKSKQLSDWEKKPQPVVDFSFGHANLLK